MESPDREALGRFARDHRVHYEIEPELVEGAGREVVGFDVRLFAVPASTTLAAPASRRSGALLRELRSFAEQLVRAGEVAGRSEVVPSSPALYQSPDEPQLDEVALTVRVHCDSAEHRQSGGEERCVQEVRRRLEAVGVPRR